MRGRFITLEGGEGAGKSTQARLLESALVAAGHRVVRTREPGGAAGAEAIRGVLLGQGPQGSRTGMGSRSACCISPRGGNMWCGPSARRSKARRLGDLRPLRRQHHGLPGLWPGRAARGLRRAGRRGAGRPGARPDPGAGYRPGEGLARAAARGETNRYEALDPDFHERVRAGFRAIAAAEPARCAVVDATAAPEGVAAEILRLVRARLAA